jgi:putative transposase
MPRRKAPTIPDALLDQILAGADAKAALESGDLIDSLKKALAERARNAEMDHHLAGDGGADNRRNGYGRKTVLTGEGKIGLDVPRDRQSSFDPQLLAKYQRRFPDFNEKIISMYARGMSVREIVAHVRELYGLDVSPDLVSAVTDAVLDEVATWQARPLEPVYPIVFFDALRVKIRDEGTVSNRAIHLALGVKGDGTKEILGMWLEQNEGAKFWLRVMNELKNRGVEDILMAVVDGLKGFPDAVTAVFPDTTVQTCVVHLLRHSLDLVSYVGKASALSIISTGWFAAYTSSGVWPPKNECGRSALNRPGFTGGCFVQRFMQRPPRSERRSGTFVQPRREVCSQSSSGAGVHCTNRPSAWSPTRRPAGFSRVRAA